MVDYFHLHFLADPAILKLNSKHLEKLPDMPRTPEKSLTAIQAALMFMTQVKTLNLCNMLESTTVYMLERKTFIPHGAAQLNYFHMVKRLTDPLGRRIIYIRPSHFLRKKLGLFPVDKAWAFSSG